MRWSNGFQSTLLWQDLVGKRIRVNPEAYKAHPHRKFWDKYYVPSMVDGTVHGPLELDENDELCDTNWHWYWKMPNKMPEEVPSFIEVVE